VVRRFLHQFDYAWKADRGASRLSKWRMALAFDCYVSPRADIYSPGQIRLARNVQIYERAMLNFRSMWSSEGPNLTIGEGTKIMPDAKLIPQQGQIKIGRNCTVQYGCVLYGAGGLEIGDNVRIATNTLITPMNHIYDDPGRPIWHQGATRLGVRIGNDVWIGAGVRILDGVHINDGCVIGAGTVVTKDLPAYSVAVGVPARVLRSRDGRMGEMSDETATR
jgi:acetyltransferase-like isoleucine patch superfamily enzyme